MTGTLKLRSILFMAISPLSLPGWWRCASCRCSCWSSCSCSAPSPWEEDVRIDVVGTDCKHGVSLRAARAAGRGQLATDAIVDVLKLLNANNSDMHEKNSCSWTDNSEVVQNDERPRTCCLWPMLKMHHPGCIWWSGLSYAAAVVAAYAACRSFVAVVQTLSLNAWQTHGDVHTVRLVPAVVYPYRWHRKIVWISLPVVAVPPTSVRTGVSTRFLPVQKIQSRQV